MSAQALADDGEHGAVPPPPDDPSAVQRSADKLARIAAISAAYGSDQVFAVITGRSISERPISITLSDDIGPDYAALDMPVWEEPQTYYKIGSLGQQVMPFNWCGPGATSGVASRWNVMFAGSDPVPLYPAQGPYAGGKNAYHYHLAYDLNEVYGLADDDPWSDGTDWPQMTSATNTASNAGTFYMQSSSLTLSQYISFLYADLHETRVPLIPVVNTGGMPGWPRAVLHWVTVKQFWQGGNKTTYGDSAGPIQGSGSTSGWHLVDLDYFYGRIAAAYNQIVW